MSREPGQSTGSKKGQDFPISALNIAQLVWEIVSISIILDPIGETSPEAFAFRVRLILRHAFVHGDVDPPDLLVDF